jgi:hypothetical protein
MNFFSGVNAFNNTGSYNKQNNTITTIETVFTNTGTVNVQAGTLALQSAGGLVNGGLLSIGAVATLDITNRFENAVTGTIQVSIASAAQFGRLRVVGSGLALLNGTLQAKFLDGYSPPSNTSFVILTFATRSGLYANVISTGLPAGRSVTQDTTVAGALSIKVL